MSGVGVRSRGFTLVELLVVILIIGIVSAAVLTGVVVILRERQGLAAGQLLQAALSGARDDAAAAGAPRGVRLLPDPGFPEVRRPDGRLDPASPRASSRWTAIGRPGDYSAGLVNTFPIEEYPAAVTGPLGKRVLVMEEAPGRWVGEGAAWARVMNEPAGWWHNIRLGERVAIGPGGVYTVCGPVASFTPEGFVNAGPLGSPSPLERLYTAPDGVTAARARPQFLLLVNGQDDDGDGYVDNGWDGIDNDADGQVDEPDEWTEAERWHGTHAAGLADATYTIERRAAVLASGRQGALPSAVVVDLTGAGAGGPRSRVRVDPYTGAVDLLFDSMGRLQIELPYAARSSLGMGSDWTHLWIADRGDVGTGSAGFKGDPLLLSISPAGRISVLTVDPDRPADVFRRALRGE